MSDTKEEVRAKIQKLVKQNKNNKYLRNLTLYTETPISSLDDVDEVVGYYETYSDRTSLTNQNIILQTIGALVSKLAEHAKARPFINTVKGDFEDKQIAKCLQKFYDISYDRDDVYGTVSEAFRDACIYDTGYIFVDRDEETVKKVYPWQVFYDNKEVKYGKPTKVVLLRKQYPTTLLDDYKNPRDRDYITYIEYWDIKTHKHYRLIKEDTSYWKEEAWEPDELPFIRMTYEPSANGGSTSTSVVDLLFGIQRTVNELCKKMGKRIRLSASYVLVPTNSEIKTDKLTNEEVQVIPFEPAIGSTAAMNPIVPDFGIDMLHSTIESLKQDAYELVGISQLSVSGQQEAGMDDMSGVAMKTMENIQADRFQLQLNRIIKTYVDIAKKIIAVFYEDHKILPETEDLNFTWKRVRKSINRFKLQFAASANLGKDPSEKYKVLKQWAADGLIPVNRITGLLDLPDLEEAASFAANSYNAIQTVIQDCLNNDVYDIPNYVSVEELKPEIVNKCLMLKSAGSEKKNQDNIKKLEKLFEACLNKESEVGKAQQADEADAMLDQESNDMDQKSAFMEWQSQQMTSIANDLQNGVIDTDQANQQLASLSGQGGFDFAG